MELTYQDKVFNGLMALLPGEYFIIAEKVSPENSDRFNETVEHLIDCDYASHYGKQIEFNSEYKKIRVSSK